MPNSELFGQASGLDAPGWGFVTGLQPDIDANSGNDYLDQAVTKGWISQNVFLNQQVIQNATEQIDAKITLEPFTDFAIDLTANRKFTENQSLYFKNLGTEDDPVFDHALPREFGSYEISYFALNTLFGDADDLFNTFLDNREVISKNLGAGTHDIDGAEFTEGYGRVQQNVVLPAFISAYTKKKSSKNNPAPNLGGGSDKDDEVSDLNFAFDFGYRNNRSFRNAFDNTIETSEPTYPNFFRLKAERNLGIFLPVKRLLNNEIRKI